MDPIIALVAVAALVVLAVAAAIVLRLREGRARHVRAHDSVDPALVGIDGWAGAITLVQFSTEFCARCPGVHRTLDAIAHDTEGVRHVDVDLTHRADLATHFHVLQTPTTLLVDRHGVIRTRFGGTVARSVVEHEIHRLSEASVAGDSHARV